MSMKYAGNTALTEMVVKTKAYVNQAIASVYKPAGTVAFSGLPTLGSSVLGNVYNINEDFTTDNRFIEANKDYPSGTNVVVVDTDTTGLSPTYKFDVLCGVFEFDVYEVATADANGYPDVATPSDKVIYFVQATNGYNTFIYDGSNFVRINGEEQVVQYTTLPSPTADITGKIVQYIGTTTTVDPIYTNGYFYKCVEDTSTTPSAYKWEAIQVQEGGSGSLGIDITSAVVVGGVKVNDHFPIGTSYDTIFDSIFNPTFMPTYVAPSASISYSVDTYYAVGATVPAKTATVTYNAGAINVNGTKQNNRGGAATQYDIATTGADTEYSDTSTSSGAFSVPTLTRAAKGTIVVTGTVSYAEGPQPKDSKGNDVDSKLPAGTVTTSKTMTFIQPFYYGKSATTTVSSLTGLTEDVTAKGNKSYKFTTNNEHMVIAYDSSYGNLKSILDPNSFEVLSGWTKSTLTDGSFTYNVYVADLATTDTNAQFTFKF